MSEDYTQARLTFKLKKAARYVRIFGVSRTLIKIRGQYHMKDTATFKDAMWTNEACAEPDFSERNIAIIGCGNYAFSNIAYYLKRQRPNFLRATYDIDKRRSMSLCRVFGGAYATDVWRDVVTDSKVKLVYIASNHASHADYAIACLDAGKNVYIEKPHVVTHEQCDRLIAAMERNPRSKVFLGFNRPKSRLFKELQRFLAKEQGPLMINWFVAGHQIPADHWYLRDGEGGRVLGNLCHWTDLTLHLVSMRNAFPCTIFSATPPSAESDFIVSIIFADRSCATITFSAKGHTFEGVRETLNVHKGNVVANLTDFDRLTIDVIDRKCHTNLFFRDHGHGTNILDSINRVDTDAPGESIAYVGATAKLFLAVRDAIDSGQNIELHINSFDDAANAAPCSSD